MFCKQCGKPTENRNGICDECMNGASNANGFNPVKQAMIPAALGFFSSFIAKLIYDGSASSANLAAYMRGNGLFLVIIGLVFALGVGAVGVYTLLTTFKNLGTTKSKMAVIFNFVGLATSGICAILSAGVFFRFIFGLILLI